MDWSRHGIGMEKLTDSQHRQQTPTYQKAYTLDGIPNNDYSAATTTTTTQSQRMNLLTTTQHRDSLPPQQHSQISNGGTMIKVSSASKKT